jgi:hypothetical protein
MDFCFHGKYFLVLRGAYTLVAILYSRDPDGVFFYFRLRHKQVSLYLGFSISCNRTVNFVPLFLLWVSCPYRLQLHVCITVRQSILILDGLQLKLINLLVPWKAGNIFI